MAGFGDAIKYLYEKFILRDVLSFITPGAIVLVTVAYLLFPEVCPRHIPWPLYIPLFGLFFITGFAIQCLGEILDLIRFTPRDRGTWCQRFKIFVCNWANDKNIWWKKAHRRLVDFREKTQDKEWAGQQHERMVILKQMCANSFLAIVIAAILLVVNCYLAQALLIFFSIIAFLLLLSLFWGYRVHVLREDTIRRAVLHELHDTNKGVQEGQGREF